MKKPKLRTMIGVRISDGNLEHLCRWNVPEDECVQLGTYRAPSRRLLAQKTMARLACASEPVSAIDRCLAGNLQGNSTTSAIRTLKDACNYLL